MLCIDNFANSRFAIPYVGAGSGDSYAKNQPDALAQFKQAQGSFTARSLTENRISFLIDMQVLGVTSHTEFSNVDLLSQTEPVPPGGETPDGRNAYRRGLSMPAPKAIKAARILREDTLKWQGKEVECYAIESPLPAGTVNGMQVSETVQTAWIDKERHFMLKQEVESVMKGGTLPGPTKSKIHDDASFRQGR